MHVRRPLTWEVAVCGQQIAPVKSDLFIYYSLSIKTITSNISVST